MCWSLGLYAHLFRSDLEWFRTSLERRVEMKRLFAILLGAASLLSTSANAALTTFTYTQTDSTTGSGTIAGFQYDDGGGPITFGPTPLPLATVINPVPGATPAGFVGAINAQSGTGNESNQAVGFTFSGFVTATGTRGTDTYTMKIPLVFAPKQTQTPDANDYNWNVAYGDSAGADASTSAGIRFAFYLSRDTIIDAADTANVYQRYTQDNKSFVAGAVDSFTNTDTTTTAIKDAMDAGAPLGTDAVGRDLGFYFGWRDTGSLATGAVLVDTFTIGGIINADQTTLVPEPATMSLVGIGALAMLGRRRRK